MSVKEEEVKKVAVWPSPPVLEADRRLPLLPVEEGLPPREMMVPL
jgi:hypothetical protein